MGELAVGAVDLAPLVEQPHDLGDLLVQQAVHRAAPAGSVGQLAGGPAVQPPVDAQLADLEHLAGGRTVQPASVAWRAGPAARTWWPDPPGAGPGHSAPTPFSLHQHQLDGHLLERLAQPGRLRPALQLQLPSRPAAPRAWRTASAWIAPSLATVRIRMIVERSTPYRSAASAIVVSSRTSCSQISYFCNGVRNRLAPAQPVGATLVLGHDQTLLLGSATRADVV